MESSCRNLSDHYNSIAEKYDDLYEFWYEPMAKILIPLLQLSPDDKVVDIGGGTGGVAAKITSLSGILKNSICVVDPSQGLIQEAKKRPNIVSVLGTADQFLTYKEHHQCNKFFFCQSSHHLPDRKRFFMDLYEYMEPGSMCVILAGAETTSLPLWKSARENFSSNLHVEVEDLQSCGFDVRFSDVELFSQVTKEQWYWKIRNRMFSIFHSLSDEELEAGIDEINNTLLFNVKNDEEITIKHDMYCIVAMK